MKKLANETEFKRWFNEVTGAIGGYGFALVASLRQANGLPDRYFTHKRLQCFLEFKKDSNRVSELQSICLGELMRRGTLAFVMRYISTGWIYLELGDGTYLSALNLYKMWETRMCERDQGDLLLSWIAYAFNRFRPLIKASYGVDYTELPLKDCGQILASYVHDYQ